MLLLIVSSSITFYIYYLIYVKHVLYMFNSISSSETTNPVFWPTVNPHDTTRTAGGSSGGEAALNAGGGSILGFGSDLGGSLHIPAVMCGVCSLKPVNMRISSVYIY